MSRVLSTYRLQMHGDFPIARARELVDYLDALGVTHIHSSPLLAARKGSAHGYDVTDPSQLNPAVGTEDELRRCAEALAERGMGIVLDIVPNHMAAVRENWRWEDVLRHGPASPYARWFDIEWRAAQRDQRNRVLLPVLGDLRVRAVERDEITLVIEDGEIRVRYFERTFPVDPATLAPVLQMAVGALEQPAGRDHDTARALAGIIRAVRKLPSRMRSAPPLLEQRRIGANDAAARVASLWRDSAEAGNALEQGVANFSEGADGRRRIRRLLDAQAYRLVFWRRAAREINYRRFFDVNELVALHMEDPEVFAESHALVLNWLKSGWIDGFRIDHPDGLLDPLGYLRRLGEAASTAGTTPPIYVEKILSHGERLRSEWPVSGTTGYDFMNQAEAAFIDPEGYARIERNYQRILRRPVEFAGVARLAKRRVLESSFSAGVRGLAERLAKLAESGQVPPRLHALMRAIVETIVYLPVYRTYVTSHEPIAEGKDRELLAGAIRDSRKHGRADPAALDVLEEALLARQGSMRGAEREGMRLRFVQRFQQLSGPATAKGIEDTAFYDYVPLLSRNEVGGEPDAPLPDALKTLHTGNAERGRHWPGTMLGVTTHDTKRTADVRSRLDVLSEIPDRWEESIVRWRKLNRRHHRMIDDRRWPDGNMIYLVYQTIIGIWPVGDGGRDAPPDDACLEELCERVEAYALKAAREAKSHTSWTEPDEAYEAALGAYVRGIMSRETAGLFLDELHAFACDIAPYGMWNALARTLIHLTAPGIPDIYQGDELWNQALVDPDNRRPVDYSRRRSLLEQVTSGFDAPAEGRAEYLRELVERPGDGKIKLHLTRRALQARRERPELFLSGSYERLVVEGPAASHVIAFVRQHEGTAAAVIVPRLLMSLLRASDGLPTDRALWAGTTVHFPSLPGGSAMRCALSGRAAAARESAIDVADAFAGLPVALLVSE